MAPTLRSVSFGPPSVALTPVTDAERNWVLAVATEGDLQVRDAQAALTMPGVCQATGRHLSVKRECGLARRPSRSAVGLLWDCVIAWRLEGLLRAAHSMTMTVKP